jgi:putative hydrolase of the HAD superfamily
MTNTAYAGIIFDFFGVVTPDPELIMFAELGQTEPIHAIFHEHDLGRLDAQLLEQKLAELPGLSQASVARAFSNKSLAPGMLDLAYQLKGHYKTGLASNTAQSMLSRYWPDGNQHEYFTTVAISETLQLVKPNPEFFRAVCSKMRVATHEAIMIDDRAKNLVGAAEAGLKTIKFEDERQLREHLAHLGVL